MAKSLVVRIIGDPTELSRSLKLAMAETETFGSKLGTVLKAGGLVAAAGVGVAAIAVDKFVKAAMAGQASQAQLDAALKSTHQSVKAMTPALDAAQASARKMGFADEESRVALAKLEIATGSTRKATDDIGVAMDIARFKHVSLTGASQMLAMAMTGSQRAIKQLGINVSPVTASLDALKASHEDLTTAIGKADTAQAKIADKMATGQAVIAATSDKLHGQAQAFADTAAGGMEQFHAQLLHLEEGLGNKLLPALVSVLNWVNSHWPQISAVADKVFTAVGAAITAVKPVFDKLILWTSDLVDYTRAHWAQISAFVDSAMRTVHSIITQVTTAAQAVWARFGSAITQVAQRDLGATVAIIRDFFRVIQGIFQLIGDVLHGRWMKVWDDLKQIVSNSLKAMVTIIETVVSDAYTAALAIGKALVGGIVAGIKSLASDVKDAVVGTVTSAVHAAGNILHGSGPFQFTNEAIGVPLGQGVLDGWTSSTQSLGALMVSQIKAAVEKTKAVITTAQTDFQTSFQGFQSIADQMFAGVSGASQTKAGKALAALTSKHDAAQLAGAITTARGDLATAQAGGDQAQILAAQQALDDALYNQHVANLTKQAAAEQLDLNARNQVKQIAFDNALQKLEEHLSKTGASTDKAMGAIQKLLGNYGISFAAVGADMGDAWVGGLADAIRAAAQKSSLLKKVIGSQAFTLGGLLGGVRAAGGPVLAGVPYLVGERGPELFMPGTSGTIIPNGQLGGSPVHVYIDGKEVFTAVQKYAKLDMRSGGAGVPG